MAIPLYVPEEYGPLPSSTHQRQPQCANPQIQRSLSCKSFLQQLILELCSLHDEYCAAAVPIPTQSAVTQHQTTGTTGTAPDVNNNTEWTFPPQPQSTSTRRRIRHPAGKNGYADLTTSLHDLMIPLTAPASAQRTTSEPKSSLEDNFANLGLQLRQIADAYAATIPQPTNEADSNRRPRSQSKFRTGWRKQFAITSLMFISLSAAAAAVVLAKYN